MNPYWPFFELRVTTPRIELRYPDDDDLTALAALGAKGVHPPEMMPFTIPWTDVPSPERERNTLKHFWGERAALSPEGWSLPMVTVRDGEVVGMQALSSQGDYRVTKAVGTGSWLGMAHQGQGIGKETRAAILHLAFDGLSADVALSGAYTDNPASIAVSRALGYEDNGIYFGSRRGKPARQHMFRLMREDWEQRRRDDIVIEGLAPCLPLLGLADPALP